MVANVGGHVCVTVGVTKCRAPLAVEGHMYWSSGRGPAALAAKCERRARAARCGEPLWQGARQDVFLVNYDPLPHERRCGAATTPTPKGEQGTDLCAVGGVASGGGSAAVGVLLPRLIVPGGGGS